MSHFAKINSNNIVEHVITAEQDFIDSGVLGDPSLWIQTSYNTHAGKHPENRPFRKNYAGIGYIYDAVRDAFIPPKPFNSWVLNEETCLYEPPVPYPQNDNGDQFMWNEEQLTWTRI